ncbi:MAG: hypothetical protein QM796_08240 [Chthoniobacteraceae bacterium]
MPPELTSTKTLLLSIALPVGYLLFMLANPARGSLRDGMRCVQRYPRLWAVFAGLGLCYALFQLGLEAWLRAVMPPESPLRLTFFWTLGWHLVPQQVFDAMKNGLLPASETVVGIFNTMATTFPISAIAAVLFLCNWEGHHAVFRRALLRRFSGGGVLLYFLSLLSALAAVVKPAIYFVFTLPEFQYFPQYTLYLDTLVVDWLSFLFEVAFGVCLQVYLILLAYVWVRGLNFSHQHLVDFAIRRFSAAMKWTAVILLLTTLVINVPHFLNLFDFSQVPSIEKGLEFIQSGARPALGLVLFAFCSMQIFLVFHGETLRKAFEHHLSFLKKQFWVLPWFLVAALLHAWALQVVNEILLDGLGERTAAGIGWRLAFPLLNALLAAWLLSSWVCLFQRWERGRSELEPLVRF